MKYFLTIALLIIPVFGEAPKCKGNPKVVSACYTVHGRATFGNGTPALRIWPVGTKRMLGITAGPIADDADDPIIAKRVAKLFTGSSTVYGDFEVCPFTPERRGFMQMVCVESASHIIVKVWPASK